MTKRSETEPSDALNDEAVVHYLRTHRDFFVHHEELLPLLTIPHPRGSAVSLVERQIAVLRERNQQLDRRLRELVDIARDNERLSLALHHLAQALLVACDQRDVIQSAEQLLRDDIGADAVAFHFVGQGRSSVESGGTVREADPGLNSELIHETGYVLVPGSPAHRSLKRFFSEVRPFCGRPPKQQARYLFPEASGSIGSTAVIRLGSNERPIGLLALASSDAMRFNPSMDTLFLDRLGELVARALIAAPETQPVRAGGS